jgi:Ferric reductase like transmembrane component
VARQNGLVMRHPPVTPAKGAGAGSVSVRVHRPGPAPRPWVVDGCAALGGLGFSVTLGTVIIGESRSSLAAPGGLLTAAGRLTGFTGAYLMLIMVVLVARLPWLEVSAGQDRLIRWHRQVAPWAFGLIASHVVLITLGYARAAQVGVLRQLWVFVTSYPDLLAAIAGFGLLVMAGVTSIRIVRRRLRYETCWVIHLYIYLGLRALLSWPGSGWSPCVNRREIPAVDRVIPVGGLLLGGQQVDRDRIRRMASGLVVLEGHPERVDVQLQGLDGACPLQQDRECFHVERRAVHVDDPPVLGDP